MSMIIFYNHHHSRQTSHMQLARSSLPNWSWRTYDPNDWPLVATVTKLSGHANSLALWPIHCHSFLPSMPVLVLIGNRTALSWTHSTKLTSKLFNLFHPLWTRRGHPITFLSSPHQDTVGLGYIVHVLLWSLQLSLAHVFWKHSLLTVLIGGMGYVLACYFHHRDVSFRVIKKKVIIFLSFTESW